MGGPLSSRAPVAAHGQTALSGRQREKGRGATAYSDMLNEGVGMSDEVKAETCASGTVVGRLFWRIEFVSRAIQKDASCCRQTKSKSFLVLFFKKEPLPYFPLLATVFRPDQLVITSCTPGAASSAMADATSPQ